MNNYAVIMAGGAGTRFWPKGTSKLPKQFLNVSHEIDTMVQQTYKRLIEFIPAQNIFVVTTLPFSRKLLTNGRLNGEIISNLVINIL